MGAPVVPLNSGAASVDGMSSATPSSTVRTVTIDALIPEKPGRSVLILSDPRTVLPQPDNLPIGPGTFFVAGDSVILQDRVNNVFAFYKKGRRVDSIELPDINCCIDMFVQGDSYWLLSSDQIIYRFKRTSGGNRLLPVEHHDFESHDATWLQPDGLNIVVQTEVGEMVPLAGPGPLSPAVRMDTRKNSWVFSDGKVRVRIVPHREPSDLYVIAETPDSWYLWGAVWTSSRSMSSPNGGYVYHINKNGELVNTYTLQLGGGHAAQQVCLRLE